MYPGKTVEITVDYIEGAVFLAKHQTGKRFRQLMQWIEDFKSAEGMEKHDLPFEILNEVLAGWRNLKHPDRGDDAIFGQDSLDEVLQFREAWPLVFAVIRGNRLSEDERKKSE